MDNAKLKHLLAQVEKRTVDFKIECHAFLSPSDAPKAELAKDICAMANNGNVASYIIVGVSDDGQTFKSVSNSKLTENNIQSFIKTAVFPPPKVRIHRSDLTPPSGNSSPVEIVVIQIGPHKRQAFRLYKDFISFRDGFCHRRNEVWIRRGPTSDLATPEEIAHLVKGEPPDEQSEPENNVDYYKLPRDEQRAALLADLRQCVEETGGEINEDDMRVVVPLHNTKYVWRYSVWVKYDGGVVYCPDFLWNYEHGIVYLVINTVPKSSFPESVPIHFREKWGWFTMLPSSIYVSPRRKTEPNADVSRDFEVSMLTLAGLRDTNTFRRAFLSMMDFLATDEGVSTRMQTAREQLNVQLSEWLKGKRSRPDLRGWARYAYDRDERNERELARGTLELSGSKRRQTSKRTRVVETITDHLGRKDS